MPFMLHGSFAFCACSQVCLSLVSGLPNCWEMLSEYWVVSGKEAMLSGSKMLFIMTCPWSCTKQLLLNSFSRPQLTRVTAFLPHHLLWMTLGQQCVLAFYTEQLEWNRKPGMMLCKSAAWLLLPTGNSWNDTRCSWQGKCSLFVCLYTTG